MFDNVHRPCFSVDVRWSVCARVRRSELVFETSTSEQTHTHIHTCMCVGFDGGGGDKENMQSQPALKAITTDWQIKMEALSKRSVETWIDGWMLRGAKLFP